MDITKVREKFKELYGTQGAVYASPGRVNLIGEHTDYNGGFVLPGAVDKGMVAEIIFNGTDKVRAYALDLGESAEFGLSEADAPAQQWAKYIFGVCRELTKRGGTIKGFDTVFSGDVPLGAGMSSSAALESTYAFALNDLLNLGFPPMELAKVGQATEHNYVGVKCGIMDQFASIHGKAGHLMRLDCKTGEFQYVPFDPEAHGYKVVLIDSCVKHELVGSPYNKRRESCERAVKAIQQRHPEVEFLRDAQPEWLDEVIGVISQEDYIRAKYAIDEVKRLLDACAGGTEDVRHAYRHVGTVRSLVRRARLPQRSGQRVRGDRIADHGRRLRRLYDQRGAGTEVRCLYRHRAGEVQSEIRDRLQGLSGGDFGRRATDFGVIRMA